MGRAPTPRTLVEVAPGVHVATSRTLRTTSTVVADRGRALLVDPAWQPDELDALADALDARGLTVVAGVATHAHHDHLLWHPRFGDVPRWASPAAARLARADRAALLRELTVGDGADDAAPGAWTADLLDVFARVTPAPVGDDLAGGVLDGDLADGSGGRDRAGGAGGGVLPDVGARLVVHDGHSPGHAAVWLDGAHVLLAGDMLSDVELPLPFDPDDLAAYADGLDRLAPLVARARVLVPGHGRPTSVPLERLDADRRYLDAVLAGRTVDDPRLDRPGMRAVHERVVGIVRGLRQDADGR